MQKRFLKDTVKRNDIQATRFFFDVSLVDRKTKPTELFQGYENQLEFQPRRRTSLKGDLPRCYEAMNMTEIKKIIASLNN